MDLRAEHAVLFHVAVDFDHGGVRVVHGQRHDVAGEAVGMGAADRRHAVIGDARQMGRVVGAGDGIERRLGQGQYLAEILTELIQQTQPRIDIPQGGDRSQPVDLGVRHVLRQDIEQSGGENMVECIDFHLPGSLWGGHVGAPLCASDRVEVHKNNRCRLVRPGKLRYAHAV
jgi:hypothetical protein